MSNKKQFYESPELMVMEMASEQAFLTGSMETDAITLPGVLEDEIVFIF
jgi:hypothetical protein